MKQCIKCGSPVTHHHKYCEIHYPKKSATILTLKNENKKLKIVLSNLLSRCINKQNITYGMIKTELEKKKFKIKKNTVVSI